MLLCLGGEDSDFDSLGNDYDDGFDEDDEE